MGYTVQKVDMGELMSGLHSTVGRYGGADEWATQYSR